MAKSGSKLGRGLGELLGEMEEVYDNEIPSGESIVELPIKQIAPNPFQPRKHFDEHSLQELSESIKLHGLIQPIVVVEDIDGYILVAGERRLRASKLAKLKTIRAVIATIDEDKMRQQALIENIQRDELNIVDLAQAYSELLEVHNITHDQLSTMVHKSRTHITNTIRLLQLSKKSLKAVVEKKISAGHAKMLIGMSEKDQIKMVDTIIGQKLSVREVEAIVKSGKAPTAKSVKESATVSLDFTQLKKCLNSLGLVNDAKNNKVTITFENEQELSELLDLLC